MLSTTSPSAQAAFPRGSILVHPIPQGPRPQGCRRCRGGRSSGPSSSEGTGVAPTAGQSSKRSMMEPWALLLVLGKERGQMVKNKVCAVGLRFSKPSSDTHCVTLDRPLMVPQFLPLSNGDKSCRYWTGSLRVCRTALGRIPVVSAL